MSRRNEAVTRKIWPAVAVMGCVVLAGGDGVAVRRAGVRPAPPPGADRSLSFEPNVGQAPSTVDFTARGSGYRVALTSTGAVLSLPGATVATEVVGGRSSARAVTGEPLPGRVNYLSADPAKTRTGIPTYGTVTYTDVYDGVDVVYYGTQGRLEYDFVVAAGADPSDIRVRFSGGGRVDLGDGGSLVLRVDGGELVQHAPVAYQQGPGWRRAVDVGYVRLGDTDFGFRLGAYDPRQPVFIDPVLSYSTYLGGSDRENPEDIAVDGSGSAYISATTASFDYPTTPGVVQRTRGGTIAVTKLSPNGDSLVYSTYLGGSGRDFAGGIAVDAAGNAYVTGTAHSPDFPTVNPLRHTLAGGQDAFVLKLNPAGTALLYSTYLGGTAGDRGAAIAVDPEGSAYVTGGTDSSDFPLVNAVQPAPGGGEDAFLTKLSPSGSTMGFSTYLGGRGADTGYGVGVDVSGQAVVGGGTISGDFPTRNPLQGQLRGPADGFVTKVAAAGNELLYSTYLGGTSYDTVADVALDGTGNAYVSGTTSSTDFPTVVPLQPALAGAGATFTEDAFVTKLSPLGAAVYSTYLGGTGDDLGSGITVDPSGRATVTGYTSSSAFPTVNPLQGSLSGFGDAFVSTVAASGSALVFSTYLGGSDEDIGQAVASTSESVYVLGRTRSTDFPTQNPVQAAPGGRPPDEDLFVSKISLSAPVVSGSTWYLSGAASQSGGRGTVVSAYAIGAFQNVAYRLVLASGQGCATQIAVLNPFTRFADSSGFIPRTIGTIPAGVPTGVYQICFQNLDTGVATGGVPFIMT